MRTTRNVNDITKRKISNGMKKYWQSIPTINPETKQTNKDDKNNSSQIPTL